MSSFIYDVWFSADKSAGTIRAADLNRRYEIALPVRLDPRGAVECARKLRAHYNEFGTGPDADVPVRIDPAPYWRWAVQEAALRAVFKADSFATCTCEFLCCKRVHALRVRALTVFGQVLIRIFG